jgi:hypothetical protein
MNIFFEMQLANIKEELVGRYEVLKEKIPFFPYSIVLILLIFTILAFAFFMNANPENVQAGVLVKDSKGNPISEATVLVEGSDNQIQVKTNSNGEALFELPSGKQFKVSVNKDGYKPISNKNLIASPGAKIELKMDLIAPTQASREVTLIFVGPDSKKLVGKEISVRLSCTVESAKSFDKEEYVTTEGELKVMAPENCGTIKASATALGFKSAFAMVQTRIGQINFQGLDLPKGNLDLDIKDADSGRYLNDIFVKLFDSSNSPTEIEGSTSFGKVSFTKIPVGNYIATINDPAGQYASQSIPVEVVEGIVSKKEVLISKDVKLKLVVNVSEKGGAKIGGADVSLFNSGGIVGSKKTDDYNGSVVFFLKDSGTYYVSAYKNDFIPSPKKEISTFSFPRGSEQRINIELEKCTPTKCGYLNVKVVDEDNLPVENAKVILLGEDGLVATAYPFGITDFNGVASIRGVGKGKFYALAQKFPAEGKSELFEVNPATDNNVQMRITIGQGTINIKAMNEDGLAVAGAQAQLIADYGKTIGVITLGPDGAGTLKVKADKSVYVIVRKEGYASYFFSPKQVLPNKIIQFNAVLTQGSSDAKPKITFLGMFTDKETKAVSLAAGSLYTAKFLMEIPKNSNYSEAGFFFRAGDKGNVSEDVVWIDSIRVPTRLVAKGETYNPPLGDDEEKTAQGNAKWVLVQWNTPEPGKYEIEVDTRIKPGTTPATELPFYYRVYAVSDSSYIRAPEDNALGSEANTQSKKGFYANSYELRFLEGIEELCNLNFCLRTRLLEKETSLYVEQPYKVKTFSPYILEFTLTNNSSYEYNNATFSAKIEPDKGFLIKSYSITNADGRVFSSTNQGYEIEQIATGNFLKNKSLRGIIEIEPKSTNPQNIILSLISGNSEVFKSPVSFLPFAQGNISLSVMPQTLPSYIQTEILVNAAYSTGKDTGFGVERAVIYALRVLPDRSETRLSAVTDWNGSAKILLPASSPGTKLFVWAEKAGLSSNIVEKQFKSEVVSFEPSKVLVSLNRQVKTGTNSEVRIINNLAIPITIKSIRESINSKGLLDETRMNTFVQQWVGNQIQSLDSKSINLLSAVGSEADLLEQQKKVSGSFIMEFAATNDRNAVWVSSLPYEALINLAEMPANAPCISISTAEWQDSTVDNQASLEFEIVNNCVSKEGAPIDLGNLQATVNWQGQTGQLGQIEFSVTDVSTGQIGREILQQSVSSVLLEKLEYGKVYPARMTFVPKPNSTGKKAEFKIKIDATLLTNAGKQFVGATNEITGSIVIANLDQCIKFTPAADQGIKLKPNQNEAEFTIDTTDCGPVEVDFRFCGERGNYQCRGGTDEGGILVEPNHFTRIKAESRNVKVSRLEIPGFYGLTIEAKPAGGTFRQIAEYDVVVEPESGEYFSMDRYAFTMIGKGKKDEATLTNYMLQEKVNVKANKCAWGEAAPGLNDSEKAGIALAGAAAGTAAGLATVLLLGASTGIGAVVGIIVFVIIIFMTILGEDPCEQFETHVLNDYVINLVGTEDKTKPRYVAPDAIDIIISDQRFKGEWMLDIADAIQKFNKTNPNGKQTVGVVFTNLSAEEEKPIYAIATMRAKEHIHGDPTHQNASVQCGKAGSTNGDFGNFWINMVPCNTLNNMEDRIYSQKFHVKFNTAEEKTYIPKTTFDSFACQNGLEIGRTGKGALPRVKFNWSWKENEGGISYNQCDADNPDYVYCDAAQFTIELNKKLNMLNEFLQENNYNFECSFAKDAKNEIANNLAEQYKASSSRNVPNGFLGVKEINLKEENNQIKADVIVENKTEDYQDVTVSVSGIKGATQLEPCVVQLLGISKGEKRNASCNFTNLEDGAYLFNASISSSTAGEKEQPGRVANAIFFGDPTKGDAAKFCEFRTTETIAGTPQIIRYIEGKNVKWTKAIPNMQALQKLLIFDAYLMKDNYSKEFFYDFSKTYSSGQFFDADSYFTSLLSDSQGNKIGFNKLMDEGKFIVRRKFADTSEISNPGLYRVELAVYFTGGDWKLIRENGSITGYIAIIMTRLADPNPNSPFYYIPFDGLVGVEANKINRKNYGTTFYNQGGTSIVAINNGKNAVMSFEDAGSNAISNVSVSSNNDLYTLNTAPQTRGLVLEVTSKEGKGSKIVFQPSQATPLIMKINSEKSSQPFSSYYNIIENSTTTSTGTSLTYWDGAGNCLDFTGSPVTEAFYQKPDRQGKESDKINDYKSIYAIDWPSAKYAGDVYLRTIIFSDPKKQTQIRAKPESKVEFMTPDESGKQVTLNGISGMKYNDYSMGLSGRLASISDAFKMVENNMLCVTSTGNSVKFWWNPQYVYTYSGKQTNISSFVNSLEAGKTCIGQ